MNTWKSYATANNTRYTIWQGYDNLENKYYYQVTIGVTYPSTQAGYYSLNKLLSEKNIALD